MLAARGVDFSAFKGEALPPSAGEQNSAPIAFKGTLELAVSGEAKKQGCTLFVRRSYDSADGLQVPPHNVCPILVRAASPGEADADFASIAAKLRDCLPGFPFTEEQTGDASNGTDVRSLAGTSDGVSSRLERLDPGAVIATAMGLPAPERNLTVQLFVTNEQPMAPGLNLEIPIMR